MRDWESTFIDLWNQGLETTEITQRLGVPKGTVQSRAHRLQHQGKIQPRGRGGAYPRQKALARQAGTEMRPPSTVYPGTHDPATSTVDPLPSTVDPATEQGPPIDRLPSVVDPQTWEIRQLKHSVRWTVYVPLALKEEIQRRAKAHQQHPSLLLQELLWNALKDVSASSPPP
jgi:hypothetical protein